jgi:hypothetical protein
LNIHESQRRGNQSAERYERKHGENASRHDHVHRSARERHRGQLAEVFPNRVRAIEVTKRPQLRLREASFGFLRGARVVGKAVQDVLEMALRVFSTSELRGDDARVQVRFQIVGRSFRLLDRGLILGLELLVVLGRRVVFRGRFRRRSHAGRKPRLAQFRPAIPGQRCARRA